MQVQCQNGDFNNINSLGFLSPPTWELWCAPTPVECELCFAVGADGHKCPARESAGGPGILMGNSSTATRTDLPPHVETGRRA